MDLYEMPDPFSLVVHANSNCHERIMLDFPPVRAAEGLPRWLNDVVRHMALDPVRADNVTFHKVALDRNRTHSNNASVER
jgi:hypothetical protein